MAIRLAGMNSGMDTDAMIQDLMKAYKKKGEKNVKEKTKYEWKRDIWSDLNKKVKSFYSKYASNMQYSTYYNNKSTSVSDNSKASVIASDDAVIGTQTLEVNQLAKAGYLTGSKLASGTTADTKLSELGFEGSTTIKITQGGGKEDIPFSVTGDTKISDVVNYIQSAGYNASFDEKNGRFFVSSKTSGEAANFSFDTTDATARTALRR